MLFKSHLSVDGDEEFRLMRTGTCFITTDYHFEQYNYNICLRQDSGKKNYLLLGDSHSAMLWYALSSSSSRCECHAGQHRGLRAIASSSGFRRLQENDGIYLPEYLPTHPVQGMFVAGRWEEKNMEGLTELIAWAQQHQVPVTVFGPVPEYDGPLPRLLAYSIAWNEPNLASEHLVASLELVGCGDAKDGGEHLACALYFVVPGICGAQSCAEYADAAHKIPLMSDTNHLTQPGASLVVQRLVAKGELN